MTKLKDEALDDLEKRINEASDEVMRDLLDKTPPKRKSPSERVARAENIRGLLIKRQSENGLFAKRSAVTQNIKAAMRKSPNWDTLTPEQAEALEMIAHKIGRILCGNPKKPDHWRDISGYAELPGSGL